MKTVCLAGVVGLMVLTGVAIAEETKPSAPVGVAKPIDTADDDTSGAADEQSGVDTGTVLPTYESYDPNTGLPDATPSDADGNLN